MAQMAMKAHPLVWRQSAPLRGHVDEGDAAGAVVFAPWWAAAAVGHAERGRGRRGPGRGTRPRSSPSQVR